MNHVRPQEYPLGPLSTVTGRTGFISDGDWVESKDQDPNGDVRLIQLADIGVGTYVDKSARFLTSEKAKKLRCTFLNSGDILVARMPDPIGRACIFPGDIRQAVTVVDVCVIRPDPAYCDTRWLCWTINSSEFLERVQGLARGATRQRIARTELEKILIAIPPLHEQRRIAAILDQAEALRAKRREALAKLDEMAQAIFVETFGDPASEFHKYPSGRLGAVCELINGDRSSNYPSGDDLVECGVPFLSTKNIRGAEFDLSNCNFITEQKFKSLSRGKLKRHDLVITLRGTLGQCAEFDCRFETGFINAQMMIIRPNPKLLPGYVREFIAIHPLRLNFSVSVLGLQYHN